MGIPVLSESCLGCCSIRTGARIISWVSMIMSAIVFIILLFAEGYLITTAKVYQYSLNRCIYNLEARNGEHTNSYSSFSSIERVDTSIYLLIILAVFVGINLLLEALVFVFGIANLYGIRKEKRNFMVPYLIVWTISLVLQIIGCIALVIIERTTSSLPVVGWTIVIGLQVYFLLVVYSYFREHKTTRNDGRGGVNALI